MNIEDLIPPLAQWLGVDPATVLLLLAVVVSVANFLGRVIPDDKTGVLGAIRKLSKLIGLHLANRVTSRLSGDDAAVVTLRNKGVEVGESLTNKVYEKIDERAPTHFTGYYESGPLENEPEKPIPPLFPKVERGPDGKFRKKSEEGFTNMSVLSMLGFIGLLGLLLGGCTPSYLYAAPAVATQTMCQNKALIEQAAKATLKVIGYCPATGEPVYGPVEPDESEN